MQIKTRFEYQPYMASVSEFFLVKGFHCKIITLNLIYKPLCAIYFRIAKKIRKSWYF